MFPWQHSETKRWNTQDYKKTGNTNKFNWREQSGREKHVEGKEASIKQHVLNIHSVCWLCHTCKHTCRDQAKPTNTLKNKESFSGGGSENRHNWSEDLIVDLSRTWNSRWKLCVLWSSTTCLMNSVKDNADCLSEEEQANTVETWWTPLTQMTFWRICQHQKSE